VKREKYVVHAKVSEKEKGTRPSTTGVPEHDKRGCSRCQRMKARKKIAAGERMDCRGSTYPGIFSKVPKPRRRGGGWICGPEARQKSIEPLKSPASKAGMPSAAHQQRRQTDGEKRAAASLAPPEKKGGSPSANERAASQPTQNVENDARGGGLGSAERKGDTTRLGERLNPQVKTAPGYCYKGRPQVESALTVARSRDWLEKELGKGSVIKGVSIGRLAEDPPEDSGNRFSRGKKTGLDRRERKIPRRRRPLPHSVVGDRGGGGGGKKCTIGSMKLVARARLSASSPFGKGGKPRPTTGKNLPLGSPKRERRAREEKCRTVPTGKEGDAKRSRSDPPDKR